MLFFVVSSRFFRAVWRLPFLSWSVCVSLVCLPWLLAFVVLRAALFVRVARPSFRPVGAVGVAGGFWSCVPSSSLPSVRRACFVWSVRPAVVSRRSGAVLWCWVWVAPAPGAGEPEGVGARCARACALVLSAQKNFKGDEP